MPCHIIPEPILEFRLLISKRSEDLDEPYKYHISLDDVKDTMIAKRRATPTARMELLMSLFVMRYARYVLSILGKRGL